MSIWTQLQNAEHSESRLFVALILVQVCILGTCTASAQKIGCAEFGELAEAGDALAQYHFAECLYKGLDGIDVDAESGKEWLELSAVGGYAPAQNAIAAIWLFHDRDDGKADAARRYLESAWEHGESQAATNLGLIYLQGLGVPSDTSTAEEWFAKAATSGNYMANVVMFAIYNFGYFGVERCPEAADYYWKNVEVLLKGRPPDQKRRILNDLKSDVALSHLFSDQQLEEVSALALKNLGSTIEDSE